MQAVILAAGKGTRLHPLTLKRTKAMMPIVGQPIVARVLETFVRHGIQEVILVISPDDQDIQTYFTEQCPLDRHVQFVPQVERLGMAQALSLAAPYIQGDFIMSACDSFTPSDHIEALLMAHTAQSASATLSLMAVSRENIRRTGIVDLVDGLVKRIVEKPHPDQAPSNIASLPLYIFSPRILDYLPEVQPSSRGEYELQDAIQMLIERDQNVRGVFTPRRWQLTTADDLLALNRRAFEQSKFVSSVGSDVMAQAAEIIKPVCLETGVRLGQGCVIGPNVYLESGCEIGDGAVIKDAVVLRETKVAAGEQILGKVV